MDEQVRSFLSVNYYNIAKNYSEKKEDGMEELDVFENNVISIIFSALTLEATINDIGIEYLYDVFDDFRAITSLPKKWRIFTRILLKKGNNLGGLNEIYGELKDLQNLRNDLVHHRSKFEKRVPLSEDKKMSSKLIELVNKQKANQCVELIEKTINVFCKLTVVKKEDVPVLRVIENKGKPIRHIAKFISAIRLIGEIRNKDKNNKGSPRNVNLK